jgi:predicted ArsR family transcriptional regulator
MLLVVIYRGIADASVTEMAKILEVSKMSVTRCFDELEAFWPGMIEDNGKAGRRFQWSKTKRELWETVGRCCAIRLKRSFCWIARRHGRYPKAV